MKNVGSPFRLREHLNPANKLKDGGGKLGALIKQHLPLSLNWTIELFDLADCEAIVAQWKPDEYKRFREMRDDERYNHISLTIAEQAFIACYHPCFNVHYNSSPTSLPASYQLSEEREANEKSIQQWIDELSGGKR